MNRTSRRAAIYARISTDKQNPLSPADQERKCREYADRNGITVVDGYVYCDEGLSGVGLDRPALQQLLRAALARTRDFDVILVDDTSRLSRSTEDVLSIYRDLNFAGLQLIAVSQNIDSHHEQAETLITIHGLIDHSYVTELSKKVHRGSESAVLRGLHVGGTCYGYALVAEGNAGSKRLVIEKNRGASRPAYLRDVRSRPFVEGHHEAAQRGARRRPRELVSLGDPLDAQARALQGRGCVESIEIREGPEDQHAAPQDA
jgi:DNA invertase Pin-like site-specific DNA recombinase